MSDVAPRLALSGPGPAPPAPEDPIRAPDGELRPPEVLFRAGLLLGAGLFLLEGIGAPWRASPVLAAGALVLSTLAVLTLAVQWRVLGDWRKWTQQSLLAGLALVLALPIAGALSPTVGGSALPEALRLPLSGVLSAMERMPGAAAAFSLVKGFAAFLLYVLILLSLAAFSGPALRGGLAVVALLVAGLALFFAPTAETLVGLLLLAFFLRVQWERPLFLPDRLAPLLTHAQREFLRELLTRGALSTGETKLYLDHDPAAFAQLAEFDLVEYDSIAREVVPGRRLVHDPARTALESALGMGRRLLWIAGGVLYLLLPDLVPGPIDDAVIMMLAMGAGFNWFGALLRGRRRGPAR